MQEETQAVQDSKALKKLERARDEEEARLKVEDEAKKVLDRNATEKKEEEARVKEKEQ